MAGKLMNKLYIKQILNKTANILILNLGTYTVVAIILLSLNIHNKEDYLVHITAINNVFLTIFLWKAKFIDIKSIAHKSKRRMKCSIIIFLFGIMLILQILSSYILNILNLILLRFNYSIQLDKPLIPSSISMFIYICFVGPMFEEFLFRGIILNLFQNYNIKSGIIISAFLFSVYHGNLNQGIVAMLVGILFAYIAQKYSIYWSFLLHMINNMISIILCYINNSIALIAIELVGIIICLYSVCYFLHNRKNILKKLNNDSKEKIACIDILQSKRFVIISLIYAFMAISNINRM